jgi:hypothetical protein
LAIYGFHFRQVIELYGDKSRNQMRMEKFQIIYSRSKIQIIEEGVDEMADTTGKGKTQKTSRGMRKHMRRVKQESRKAGTPVSEWKKKVRIQPIAKKKAA